MTMSKLKKDFFDIKIESVKDQKTYTFEYSVEQISKTNIVFKFTDMEVYGGKRELITILFKQANFLNENGTKLLNNKVETYP